MIRYLVAFPAANLGNVTLLDGCDGSSGTALGTSEEEQTVFLAKGCVGFLAGLADDILADVVSHDVLNLLWLEAAANRQAVFGIKRAGGSKFGQGVGLEMLLLSSNGIGGLCKVRPHCLARSLSVDAGWRTADALVALVEHIGVVVFHDVKNAIDKLFVAVVVIFVGFL